MTEFRKFCIDFDRIKTQTLSLDDKYLKNCVGIEMDELFKSLCPDNVGGDYDRCFDRDETLFHLQRLNQAFDLYTAQHEGMYSDDPLFLRNIALLKEYEAEISENPEFFNENID